MLSDIINWWNRFWGFSITRMNSRKVIPICLACLIGAIQTMTIVENECEVHFLKSLREANFDRQLENGTLKVTLNLKYLSKDGESRTAMIKLSDHCSALKIICEGEKVEVNGEPREGPLLYCSWKWKPEDSVWNEIEIGLTDDIAGRNAVSAIGRLSKEAEDVFPEAANKGPLDFKIITANGSGLLRRKRRSKSNGKVCSINVDRKRKKKAHRN